MSEPNISAPAVIIPPFPGTAAAPTPPVPPPPTPPDVEANEPSLARQLLHSTAFTALFFGACYALPHYKLTGSAVLMSPSLFVFACWALVKIAIDASITESFSKLVGKLPLIGESLYDDSEGVPTGLLTCPLCTGMWMGMILSVLGVRAFGVGDGLSGMLALAVHGLLGSGGAFLGHLIEARLSRK